MTPDEAPELDTWLSLSEAARRYGTSRQWVSQLANSGRFNRLRRVAGSNLVLVHAKDAHALLSDEDEEVEAVAT